MLNKIFIMESCFSDRLEVVRRRLLLEAMTMIYEFIEEAAIIDPKAGRLDSTTLEYTDGVFKEYYKDIR